MPLDIGFGLLLGLAHTFVTGGYPAWQPLALGVLFALLPDLDFLIQAARRRSFAHVDHTHRDTLHHPIPYLVLGSALVWLLMPQYLALFIATSLVHFLHDSIGVGYGIPWLSPFSQRYGKLFCNHRGDFSWTSCVWWKRSERDVVIAQRHDPDWVRNHYYGKWTFTSATEVVLLSLAVLAVLIFAIRF